MKNNIQELKNKYGLEKVYVVFNNEIDDMLNEGFVPYNKELYRRLITKSFPIRRYNAEHNPKFRQVIPYIVIRHADTLFVYKRLEASGEERLVGNWSIGTGGHINVIDSLAPANIISNCVVRELHEELCLNPNSELKSRVIGFINDNSNDVSQDHIGVVVLLDISKPDVTVREKDKLQGGFCNINEIKSNYDNLEAWSKVLFNVLYKEMKEKQNAKV